MSFNNSGVLGGPQLGYDWRFNRNWLAGLETDFDWSGMKGSSFSGGLDNGMPVFPFSNTVTEKVDWFGTVRARLGYLPMDNLLTYFTGGFAYGRIDRTGNYVWGGPLAIINNGQFAFLCSGGGATCFSGSSSSTAAGWTLGAGFEYAVWKNWTVKTEYLFVNLGGKSLTQTALNGGGITPSSFNANYSAAAFNVARVGINYQFSGPGNP